MRKRSSKINKRSSRRAKHKVKASAAKHSDHLTKNFAAVELGRLGGKKGGVARAKKLSARRRSQIAQRAAIARWSKTQ